MLDGLLAPLYLRALFGYAGIAAGLPALVRATIGRTFPPSGKPVRDLLRAPLTLGPSECRAWTVVIRATRDVPCGHEL
ncbi:hypothetical protein [Actinoallomurus sp. CA-142502]|uniref:hypothetical protein n=1 Tax=Actinoallomurus sp. CA-142502 TaxID=3239885 RepID=UPI003D92CAA5